MLRRTFFACAAAVAMAMTGVTTASAQSKDIVDTAVDAGTFGTLVAAVQAADLVSTLKSDGPFTVFAPTDEAFAALPEGTVENLLLPENKDQLVAILTYHVVPAKVMAGELLGKKASVLTVEGDRLQINGRNNKVKVNSAKVVAPDVVASNGVIHVIDKVLIPE